MRRKKLWMIPAIVYAHRHYSFPWRFLIQTWRTAALSPRLGELDFLGFEREVGVEFFSALAHRQSEEADEYHCVEGNCIVVWTKKRGNIGGWGAPGCPCDNLKDPRDLVRGIIEKETP